MNPKHFKLAKIDSLSSHGNQILILSICYLHFLHAISSLEVQKLKRRDVDLHLPNAIVSPRDNLS